MRSYLYVEDVAEAFDTVLHKGVVGETYNIGTEKERSVLDVAADIAKFFELGDDKIVHVKDRAFNDRWVGVAGGFESWWGHEGRKWRCCVQRLLQQLPVLIAAILTAASVTVTAAHRLPLTSAHRAARRRYYIGCDKLAALGWTERTQWEDGLRKTISWYLDTQCSGYWEGDLELALRPHPVVANGSLALAAALKPGQL